MKVLLQSAVAAALVFAEALPAQAAALLDVAALTKYLDPLPNPLDNIMAPTGTLDGAPLYDVSISQFQQQLHSHLPPTTLWGYNGMYPGPTFDVERDETIKVRWTNNLVDASGQPLAHFLPYDPRLHGAGPPGGHAGHGTNSSPQARTTTHLHGGVLDEFSDGFPEYWFTADPNAAPNGLGGPAGNSFVMTYPNRQRAAGTWYHDHAMAITRLNIYAGMAGHYLIRDEEEASLGLPTGDYEIPLMLQDRSFYDDGQLYYPGQPTDGNPGQPSHVSFFLGDATLVNGVVWPFLEVEPRKYRFRMVNGANSRTYNLSLVPDEGAASQDPVMLHQIGTDGGLFSNRVDRSAVTLSPADRADVIVDFSRFNVGDTLRLRNDDLNATDGTTDQVMQFRIVPPTGVDESILPDSLSAIARYRPEDAAVNRSLQLVRAFDEEGGVRLLLDGKRWSDAVSEVVRQGDLEIWAISNTTGEDHPIHLHLEAFQVLSRTSVLGADIPLEDHEWGWEDTFTVRNGEVVRFMVKYDQFAGIYVWHCHILEHEDNEMMRPLQIVPPEVPEPATGMTAVVGLLASLVRRRHWTSRRR
jgi:spore coat protein A, manganese oxidase